jgi:hypothetical protein
MENEPSKEVRTDEIRTQRLVITDKAGRDRLVIFVEHEGPEAVFYDENGAFESAISFQHGLFKAFVLNIAGNFDSGAKVIEFDIPAQSFTDSGLNVLKDFKNFCPTLN